MAPTTAPTAPAPPPSESGGVSAVLEVDPEQPLRLLVREDRGVAFAGVRVVDVELAVGLELRMEA